MQNPIFLKGLRAMSSLWWMERFVSLSETLWVQDTFSRPWRYSWRDHSQHHSSRQCPWKSSISPHAPSSSRKYQVWRWCFIWVIHYWIFASFFLSLLIISRLWEGAFITSTSRLVLPVRRCELLPGVEDIEGKRVFDLPESCSLIERISDLVKKDLKAGGVDASKDCE